MPRTRSARAKDGSLTEEAWQNAVVDLARVYGWKVYHPPDNRPSRNTGRVQKVVAGFPDLTLVRGAELIFAELKTDKGRLGPGQQEWLDALRVVGEAVNQEVEAAAYESDTERRRVSVDVYLWRPADLDEVHVRLKQGWS